MSLSLECSVVQESQESPNYSSNIAKQWQESRKQSEYPPSIHQASAENHQRMPRIFGEISHRDSHGISQASWSISKESERESARMFEPSSEESVRNPVFNWGYGEALAVQKRRGHVRGQTGPRTNENGASTHLFINSSRCISKNVVCRGQHLKWHRCQFSRNQC